MMGIRINRETKKKLGVIAQEQHRTLSAQALFFIIEGVKHQEALAATSDKPLFFRSGVKHRTGKGGSK
jgi:predicted transcriptional regulator